MQVTTLHESPSLSIYDCRCDAGPRDKPFVEAQGRHSLAFVRRGSLGCRTLGATHKHHACDDTRVVE